ncbi:hypothetical protein ISN44_As12g025310, partial [Arabidopsis suecica]
KKETHLTNLTGESRSLLFHNEVWFITGEILFSDVIMPFKTVIEVEPPSLLRYLIGAAVMMIGVVLPVGYMMFRNKRVPFSSSYSKQT